MWSWISLKPSLRSAYPLMGSAASAEGVMSTLAAPARSVSPAAPRGMTSDAPINRIARNPQVIMIISPDLECHPSAQSENSVRSDASQLCVRRPSWTFAPASQHSMFYLVFVTAAHLPFVMNTRLRIPFAEPLLVVLAAG